MKQEDTKLSSKVYFKCSFHYDCKIIKRTKWFPDKDEHGNQRERRETTIAKGGSNFLYVSWLMKNASTKHSPFLLDFPFFWQSCMSL